MKTNVQYNQPTLPVDVANLEILRGALLESYDRTTFRGMVYDGVSCNFFRPTFTDHVGFRCRLEAGGLVIGFKRRGRPQAAAPTSSYV